MRIAIVLLLCLWLVGCSTTPKKHKLELGMTKSEVIKLKGKPHSTKKRADGVKVLVYEISPTLRGDLHFLVILRNGKVVSYGFPEETGIPFSSFMAEQQLHQKKLPPELPKE